MSQPSDSDPFMDLEFDLIDEDSVIDEPPSQDAKAETPPKADKPPKPPKPPPRKVELEVEPEPPSLDFGHEDIFARDTAIPSLPADEFAAASMRTADLTASGTGNTQPPPGRLSDAPPSAELEFADFGHAMDVFGQALPGAPAVPGSEPTASPETPRFLPSSAPTPPPSGPAKEFEIEEPLGDTTRNPMFVENGLRAMAEIPDSVREGSPLGFVDSHARFVNSLSPVAGLESSPSPKSPVPTGGSREMQDAYDLGDYTRALEVAEELLSQDSGDANASRIAQESRDVLTQMLAARVGPLDQVIRVIVSPEELQWLALDHRAGFLLSLIDGQSSVDEILDISGMTRHDALKIILDLSKQQVVELS